MTWSLYKKVNDEEKFLEPLCFSNQKSQEDVVKEVLDAVKNGYKIIFIHGVCGTGKSAIALNIAKNLGKTSIVVPIKNLQEQYKKDYESNKFLKKQNGEKLKISVITGRKNHKCKFVEDNSKIIPLIKKEIDSKLHDIFEGVAELKAQERKKDQSADRDDLPCKIEIKEKNLYKLKEYLKQNKKVNPKNFNTIHDIKRVSVAPACPYWSPVFPEKYELKIFENAKQRTYEGLEKTKFIFYQRKPGCKFYEQFNSYIDADVLVFNSLKYLLESAMNRKPKTEVEIIDECDDFLDKFSNERTINIDRLQKSLTQVYSFNEEVELVVKEIQEIINHLKKNPRTIQSIENEEIIPLKETGLYDILKIFLKSSEFLQDVDEQSYLFEIEDTARMFKDFFDDSYVTFSKRDNSIRASIVTTNLAKRFKKMLDKNKIVVLMSGTLHSDEVLKKVFGLENYIKIEAETKQQGEIEILKTGLEIDCKYSNFSSNKHSREEYLKALDKSLEISKKPCLVHIQTFTDLPNKKEIEMFELKNLISREELYEIQEKDKTGKQIEKFKKKEIEILFSTRASRGMDFPGEECNSVVFTKFPYPNVKDAFWKILSKTNPEYYWEFYKDKALREILQKVYRALRFKDDHVFVLSPDKRVLEFFEKREK